MSVKPAFIEKAQISTSHPDFVGSPNVIKNAYSDTANRSNASDTRDTNSLTHEVAAATYEERTSVGSNLYEEHTSSGVNVDEVSITMLMIGAIQLSFCSIQESTATCCRFCLMKKEEVLKGGKLHLMQHMIYLDWIMTV